MAVIHSTAWQGGAAQRRAAPQPFVPKLIGELKTENAEILRLHAELESMAISGRYESMAIGLGALLAEFYRHMVTQNLQLYPYLENYLSRSAAALALIEGFQAEMNVIERELNGFVRRYQASGVRFTNGKAFLEELRRVGALLVLRLDREEKDLYTLYTT